MSPGTRMSDDSSAHPLLAPRDLDAPLAWRAGVPVSGHAFLADVARQAERMPAGDGPVAGMRSACRATSARKAWPDTGTPARQASGAARSRGASSARERGSWVDMRGPVDYRPPCLAAGSAAGAWVP